MKVVNPYSQEVISTIELMNRAGVLKCIQQGKNAELAMNNLSSVEKSTILNQLIQGIKQRYDSFIDVIIKESAKPYIYAKAEVDRAIETFTIAAEECKRLPHELIDLDQSPKGKGVKGEVYYFPVGLVVGISPFNFPLNLAVHKIAPAIASGCPIILKPSSKTPLTMELLKEVILTTDLPKNAFQLIHCSREVGEVLVKSDDVKVLSFTGSPKVGWDMKSSAGKKKVVLELGGNAAAIVCADADIDLAVRELSLGGFAYSGQVCIHTQRIYVHHTKFIAFRNQFLTTIKGLTIGDPQLAETNFSVMIDEANVERVESWVRSAIDSGAELLLGGQRKGAFYPPTVLTNVAKGEPVIEEEVFGPVVILESYDDFQLALNEVNDSRWGLQASIFTDSISTQRKAFNTLKVGALIHNLATTFRVDNMPYGGIKDSGFGREGVKYAMLDFLEPRLLVAKK